MEQEKLITLVNKARAGEIGAMEQLLTEAYTTVSYQCRKFMHSPEDAEDMTQEVLLVIYQKLDTLTDPAAFHGWVKRIAATRCMNAVSRTHGELQFAEDEDGNSALDTIEELDAQKVPEAALDNAETARMVVELVDALPEAQRICTYLYYYNELSVKEIAKLTGATENTVKSRLNYARKAIKEGVLEHEKKGVKLYSLSPVPFLAYYLWKSAQAEAGGAAAASCVTSVMAANAAAGAAAATGATAAAASGKAAAGVAGSLAGKIIAGVVAGAVALGGIAAATVQLINTHAETVPAMICRHEWEDADCTTPKTCGKCGSAEGEALGHTWVDADCEHPQTCQTCGATEGEALGHTWTEATCETPQICEVCAAVGAEALGHDMKEANYQQPATCKACGYAEGEVLTPAAVAYGLNVIDAEMGVEYYCTTSCWGETPHKTVATVTLIGYSVFDSGDGCEPLEGYEWHRATIRLLFNDNNAWRYGYNINYLLSDYYSPGVMTDTPSDGSSYFAVNFYGERLDRCLRIIDGEGSGWDRKTRSYYYDYTYTWRVPVGYDGYLFTVYDPEYAIPIGQNAYEHMDPNALIFRFPKRSCTPPTTSADETSEKDPEPAEHTHTYTTRTVAPTTEAEGYDEHFCPCGSSYRDNYTPKIEIDRTGTYKHVVMGATIRPDGTLNPAVVEWIPWDCATQGHHIGDGSTSSVVQEATCTQPKIIKSTCNVVGCDGAIMQECGFLYHTRSVNDITGYITKYRVRRYDGYSYYFDNEASAREKADQIVTEYKDGTCAYWLDRIACEQAPTYEPEYICVVCGNKCNGYFAWDNPDAILPQVIWEESYTRDNQPNW